MFPHIKCVQYIAVVIPSKMKYIYVVLGFKGLSFKYSVVIHKCLDIIAMGRKVLMLCQEWGRGSLSIEDDVFIGVHCFDDPCSDPGDLQKNKSTPFFVPGGISNCKYGNWYFWMLFGISLLTG